MPLLRGDRAFGAIFDRAVDAIFLADDEGRYLRVNPGAALLTGYASEELQAMTVFDLTPTPRKEEGLAMWREFIRMGVLSGEYTLTRKDGVLLEVEFQAVANIMPGVHLSIVRDVTARNRERRRLRRGARLQEATAALGAAVDTAQVAEAIVAAGMAALDAQSGHVFAVVDSGRAFEVVATAGMGPEIQEQWAASFGARGFPPRMVDGRYRFSLEVPTLFVDVFRSGESIHVQQIGDLADTRARSILADLGHSMALLPLVVSGVLVGGLYLFWKEKRSLCEDEIAFVKTLAGLCGQALDRGRLFSAEREARERAVASEKAVLDQQHKLQRMAFEHAVVEERERRRVAAALHDGVSQYLALAKMTLDPLRQKAEGADRTALDAAMKLITEAIDETRSLGFELSPPILYDLGIKAALSWLGEKLERTTGLRLELEADGDKPSLDDVTASIVFRTVRELLMNVVKHAKSSTVKVFLRQHRDHLEVIVADSGAGFDPANIAAQGGFGLTSVREQIGRLGGAVEVTSTPNKGTRVRVFVPSRPPIA